MRARRAEYAGDRQRKPAADRLIHRRLRRLLQAMPAGCLSAYIATPEEVDLEPMFAELTARGWRLALPAVEGHDPGSMQMHEWRPGQQLRANRYGIAEPLPDSPRIPAAEVDVCLLPVLGFTAAGWRLGMGGGYYDRWLGHCGPDRPLRIGLGYHWQQLDELPQDTWDQPLHRIVTDRETIDCGKFVQV